MNEPRGLWIEQAITVLGLLSFWPWVFGYRGAIYTGALVFIVIGLVVVALRRVKRFNHSLAEHMPGPSPGKEKGEDVP